jgi:hypothetical protein
MAVPNAPTEGAGDKILFGVYNSSGTNAAALVHAVVTKTLNSETIGWLATATHADLATFAASDPVALAAGYDGTLVRKMLVDASGRQVVVGASAVAAAVAGNPVLVGGTDGTNARYILLDTSGRQIAAGEVVDNAAFTDGTTRVLPAGFILDETAGTALTENDAAAARIDSKRAIVNVLEDATTRGQRAAVSSVGSLAVDTRPLLVRLSQTPTVSNGAIYAAKDAIGGLLTFAGATRANGGTGIVTAVQILDKGQQMGDMDLILFDRTFTAPTDNAIFAPTDTEAGQSVGVVKFVAADWADFSTNSVASKNDVGLAFKLDSGTSSLFGALVARGMPTYTSTSDIVVTITVQQN